MALHVDAAACILIICIHNSNCSKFVCPGTESCIRLIDVDEDGKLDIIFSVARLFNTSIDDLFHDNASQQSFHELCRQRS